MSFYFERFDQIYTHFLYLIFIFSQSKLVMVCLNFFFCHALQYIFLYFIIFITEGIFLGKAIHLSMTERKNTSQRDYNETSDLT